MIFFSHFWQRFREELEVVLEESLPRVLPPECDVAVELVLVGREVGRVAHDDGDDVRAGAVQVKEELLSGTVRSSVTKH